jgi:hypothetical protein
MPKSDSTTTTELILKVALAQIPISLRGVLEDGALKEISGCVTIEKSLLSILQDLGADYGEAADVLKQLLGAADIKLDKLGATYRSAQLKSIQVGLLMTIGGSCCQFALLKNLSKDGFIASLDYRSDKTPIPKKINVLSGLIGDITIGNLSIFYANQSFDNLVFYPGNAFHDATQVMRDRAQVVGRDFPKGLSFSAEILVNGNELPLDKLALKEQKNATSEKTATPENDKTKGEAQETLSKGLTQWIKVDKTIGSVSVRRIGLSYEAPNVGIKFDAGLTISALTLSLEGMGISYPVDRLSRDPKEIFKNLEFHLDGAAAAFAEGPLTISGGLLKVKDDPLQLDGALLIRTEMFSISALGSYTDLDGTPSFFMFAVLHKELGGPAFFFVTGLAFGFGINRTLKLPPIEEVQNFPLIRAATDPDYLGKNTDLRTISQRLEDYVSPSPGNLWIAAGVKFTSFGQIDSFALLSVSFGTQFEIALLGLSKIRVPRAPAETIAYAELTMKAVFAPDSGLLSFEARLTENSYILRKDFKLRGGFAFYSWFAGEHEGDFVVSLGGYHPRFKAPAHYPKPDLVEFHCKTGNTTIQGSCYFALCPAAIMAGGGLSIVYQSGGITAWFIAKADFLIQWKPLYYDIAIGVTVGVALNIKVVFVRVRLSLELGASVHLYGPPLGGKARISLYIVSFTVTFGRARSIPPPLLWESGNAEKSFAKSFLPDLDVTRISIADGLLQEIKNEQETTRLVNPHRLVLSYRTQVPAIEATVNSEAVADLRGPEVGVRPMNKNTMYSCIAATLEPIGDASESARKYLTQHIDISPITKNVPLALWGKEALDTRSPPKNQMIDNALVGVELRTKPGPRPWETPALDMKVLAYDRYSLQYYWTTIEPHQGLRGFGDKTISNTITENDVVKKRSAIIAALKKRHKDLTSPEQINLSQLKENAQYLFQAMPAMARVGQYPPRGYRET